MMRSVMKGTKNNLLFALMTFYVLLLIYPTYLLHLAFHFKNEKIKEIIINFNFRFTASLLCLVLANTIHCGTTLSNVT